VKYRDRSPLRRERSALQTKMDDTQDHVTAGAQGELGSDVVGVSVPGITAHFGVGSWAIGNGCAALGSVLADEVEAEERTGKPEHS